MGPALGTSIPRIETNSHEGLERGPRSPGLSVVQPSLEPGMGIINA